MLQHFTKLIFLYITARKCETVVGITLTFQVFSHEAPALHDS